jgi:hypothetical protein
MRYELRYGSGIGNNSVSVLKVVHSFFLKMSESELQNIV